MGRTIAAIFLVLVLAVPAAVAAESEETPAALVGKKAPAFSVVDTNGSQRGLEALLATHDGVLLNFWGLRCGACIEEIPHLNRISAKNKDRLIVLGINVDAVDAAVLAAQMAKNGIRMDYPVIPDPEFKLVDSYKMAAAPLTVLIGKGGTVVWVHENYSPGDEKQMEDAVAGLSR